MKNDELTIEYLPDGGIKAETNSVSQANHSSAESFLKVLAQLMGGDVVRAKRGAAHAHTHDHAHEGHTH